MAAVTRPGPADARVPCPLCGGLIHPIAGRCKHCKGDLRAMRTARPAAGATLPSLGSAGAASPAPANGNANGHADAAPRAAQPPSIVQAVAAVAPIPLAIQHGPVDAAPILPPRPTGRLAEPAPRASWKSWPVVVIVLAVIAIVTAVVLMLFPPGGAPPDGEGTRNSLQPAPERMNTSPAPAPTTPRQPPSTSPDPWSRRGGPGPGPGSSGGGAAPAQPPAADDRDIDDPDVDDALTSRDPLSRRGGLGGSSPRLGVPGTDMLYSLFKHACARATTCGTSNPQVEAVCQAYAARPPVAPPTCAAATRCLRSIDQLSCDVLDDVQSLYQLRTKLSDCGDAMSC